MGRLLRVSVHGIDGSWIDLTPESFGTGGAIPLSLRVPIPKDKRDEINWDEFSFKLERTFTSFDDGMDLDFFFDNVALVSDVAPYVYMDGTSMAAPVVTGSCALLAGLFPNDGAEQLRARILGGVKRADALAGTCTSDGQLDVVRAATDPYPVVDALEPAADGTLEATVRGSWFGEDRGRDPRRTSCRAPSPRACRRPRAPARPPPGTGRLPRGRRPAARRTCTSRPERPPA